MVKQRKDYAWNSIAGIINAAEAVIMSMVVTRFGSLEDAGVLSLAFAAGNVLMTVGKYGGRMYQVTDARKQYRFYMYLIQRALTIGLMVISLIGFLLFEGYAVDKRNAIIIITAIYMIESLEDCFWGHYQATNRLYIGAQMFSTRWLAILVVFISAMIMTGDMNKSLLAGGLAGCIVFITWLVLFWKRDNESSSVMPLRDIGRKSNGWLFILFRQTAPLFLASFCAIFISNIPKFAIDQYMNDEVQACYGFVAMPVFVIGMLNQFIYQPTVVRLTDEYCSGMIDRFRKDVKRQMIIVCGIMAACVIGAGLIGIPVLSIIYHTDLSNYWKELVILQFAGGFLAISGYFTILLTLMRRQRTILIGYVVALVVGIILLNYAVQYAGTVGASVGYLLVMVMLFAFYLVSYMKIISNY